MVAVGGGGAGGYGTTGATTPGGGGGGGQVVEPQLTGYQPGTYRILTDAGGRRHVAF